MVILFTGFSVSTEECEGLLSVGSTQVPAKPTLGLSGALNDKPLQHSGAFLYMGTTWPS